MAHPQSNFTSTFNGTPLGNAKLTLSVNGVDHEYTPSGNDQTVDINGNEVVHIDDPDFVQLLNVADADKCELIIKQDIPADGAYRKYRLADCHVLNGDREWRFTCIAGNIEYILTITKDGSVTPSQRLIPGASDDLPLEDGTALAGTSDQYSRKDHVHPHDSTKEDKSNKTSYIDPTINQSGNYLGGSAVNGFVEKRTFAISIPYGTTNSNTFTKILEFEETFDGSRTRGSIFARLKIQFIGTSIRHRLREIDAYIGYELNGQKAFVTFGNCYNTLIGNDLKKLHIVTYDTAARRHVEVYLEHRELTAMTNWISVELCENFQILENSWASTQTSHSAWKIPLLAYDWDEVNGASVQPTAAALPTTGVLKTDSYIIQSGNQAPFTYAPSDDTFSDMAIAKLAKNSGDTRLVFKLYSSEGWVAIGRVKRVNNAFKLSFFAIADSADFEAGVAVPYIYLSNLDGVYFVNLKIDSYHAVAKSIAIEIENENKDWEFLGGNIPDSVGTAVSGTDTCMKADPTAEVIDQGTNVPAPTSSTKVLTKQVDAAGREFWMTEQMSAMTVGRASISDNLSVHFHWNNRNDQSPNHGLYHKIFSITDRGPYQQAQIGLLCSVCVKAGGTGYRALMSIDPLEPVASKVIKLSGTNIDVDFVQFYYNRTDANGKGALWAKTPNFNDYTIDLTVLNPAGFTIVEADNTDTSNTEPTGAFQSAQVGSPVNPAYMRPDGSLAQCNLRLVNTTADIQLDALGSGEDAWIRVRNAGSSSITVIAGTLNRTLSPSQSCDVYGYNGSYVQIS